MIGRLVLMTTVSAGNTMRNNSLGSNTAPISTGSNTASPDQGNNNIGIIAGGAVGALLATGIALCVMYLKRKLVSLA